MTDHDAPVDRGLVRPDPSAAADAGVPAEPPDGTVERDTSRSGTGLSSDDTAGLAGGVGKDHRGYHPPREFSVQDQADHDT
jgi:hypothetical protein